jgi:hypothetical protein
MKKYRPFRKGEPFYQLTDDETRELVLRGFRVYDRRRGIHVLPR